MLAGPLLVLSQSYREVPNVTVIQNTQESQKGKSFPGSPSEGEVLQAQKDPCLASSD